MSKKKIFLIILLTILIGFILFLYNGFNGNPVSKFFSTQALENHLEETYPEEEYRIDDGFYNFKVEGYEYTVTEIGSVDNEGNLKEYRFTMQGFVLPKVVTDGIYDQNLDFPLATRLNNDINAELSPILAERVPSIRDVEFHIEVLKGTYPVDIPWSKDLVFEKPLRIFAQVDSTEQTEEEFFKVVTDFRNVLNEEGYNYESIMFNGNFFEMESEDSYSSYVKYSIRVNKDGEIDKKDVEKHNEEMW